jgi:hypothetical protein
VNPVVVQAMNHTLSRVRPSPHHDSSPPNARPHTILLFALPLRAYLHCVRCGAVRCGALCCFSFCIRLGWYPGGTWPNSVRCSSPTSAVANLPIPWRLLCAKYAASQPSAAFVRCCFESCGWVGGWVGGHSAWSRTAERYLSFETLLRSVGEHLPHYDRGDASRQSHLPVCHIYLLPPIRVVSSVCRVCHVCRVCRVCRVSSGTCACVIGVRLPLYFLRQLTLMWCT